MAQTITKGQTGAPLYRMFKGFTLDYDEDEQLYVIGQEDGLEEAPVEVLLYAEQIDHFIATLKKFKADIAGPNGEGA
ncbi:hypothetical protein [Pseudomonas sp. RIT-PI-AD]|uniref:hypothetical protein n=1 Tax=Pseudomonas sp. RIT-PI-AD TaxID=3035294 RepID=UPI0021D9901A|nr:hypothetical protein [Pseudomonas sp. RIT-PI-AD]